VGASRQVSAAAASSTPPGRWAPSAAPGLRFEGRDYRLEGARPGPAPAHPIEIWLGAAKPRALALTGRMADGWAAPLMNYMPPAAAVEAQALIDRAAREAGRDPGEIRRIYNMPGAFTAAAPAPVKRRRLRRPLLAAGRSARPSRGQWPLDDLAVSP
jgi:alkanesulfonate monooxygenase SsuD/methylene tetrahydromethanopterin reductase-like flavin-dependent oxidoreductase (luciferase family)